MTEKEMTSLCSYALKGIKREIEEAVDAKKPVSRAKSEAWLDAIHDIRIACTAVSMLDNSRITSTLDYLVTNVKTMRGL